MACTHRRQKRAHGRTAHMCSGTQPCRANAIKITQILLFWRLLGLKQVGSGGCFCPSCTGGSPQTGVQCPAATTAAEGQELPGSCDGQSRLLHGAEPAPIGRAQGHSAPFCSTQLRPANGACSATGPASCKLDPHPVGGSAHPMLHPVAAHTAEC